MKKLKVFKVWVVRCDYDEFDSFVVVAESEEAVRKNFSIGDAFNYQYADLGDGISSFLGFNKWQVDSIDDIHIDEVDLTKEAVICASYNAG